MDEQSKVEKVFENILWSSRFFVLFAVVFGLLSSLTLFILGSQDIIKAIKQSLPQKVYTVDHNSIVAGIIGAIDLYLIGIVVLIFSFGVYELFISKIDIGRANKEIKILEITTLDQLKNKLLKVIIMVLVVAFFKRVISMEFTTALEMLYFALSILAISLGVYFLRKHDEEH